ncbi:uncharacterized protein LOC116700703 [Etheostoma spectabile]|uniref:uncharacterized protein LOC116700703 n=1 Tax=Etheostoma spectabile TaxID=54343 RepID=UPI0013AFD4FD|nr:uncharacterized protein LOC116700703 [Etheostoma spectabile]
MMKIKSGLDLIKSEAQVQLEFEENHKPLENQFFSEVNQGSKNTSTPCPPNTRPTTGCTNDTISLANMQQSDGAVKQETEPTSKQVHFPPISETVQLTESQFKPHPPLIRGGSAHDQLSYRTAYLDQTMLKYGRVLKLQQRDALQGSVLTPVPPNTLPAMKTSPHMQMGQTMSKYGRVLKLPQRDTLQDSVLTPVPPKTLPGMEGSQQIPDHVHLPPIHDKVHCPHHQTRSKFQQRDTLKGSFLPPCQPNTLPALKTLQHIQLSASTVNHGYKITSKYVPLPPISDKLTTDCTNATRSSSRLLRRGIKR